MKKSHVNILMVILFSPTLVSFSYAGSSCCPGAGCCDTTNISVYQQQLRAPLTDTAQTKLGTVKKPAPQINPMTWSTTVNRIGAVQLAPTSVSAGCYPGANGTSGCCPSEAKTTLPSRSPDTSMVDGILASSPFLGTLW